LSAGDDYIAELAREFDITPHHPAYETRAAQPGLIVRPTVPGSS
jgi:hypothetical protein